MSEIPTEPGEGREEPKPGEPEPGREAATGENEPRRSPAVISDTGRTIIVALVSAVVGGLLVVMGNLALGEREVVSPPSAAKVRNSDEGARTAAPQGGLTAVQIYDRFGDAVVHIAARGGPAGRPEGHPDLPFPQRGDGSGFFIDERGHIVTNAHVVQGAESVKVTLPDGKEFKAKIVGMDLSSDIALLKIDAPQEKITVLEFGDSSDLAVGDPVYAIGNPFGEFDRSMSHGIVSAIGRTIEAPNQFSISNVIQTDAAVNPGNSGGPLLDVSGRVIGVNAQIAAAGSDQFAGVAFSIPSNTVKSVVRQLRTKGKIVRAWLGVQGLTITPSLVESLKLPVDEGALIARVTKDGPADKAGIKGGVREVQTEDGPAASGGDIIVEFGGKKVRSMDDLVRLVESRRPGEKVDVEIFRGSKRETEQVTLGERPEQVER